MLHKCGSKDFVFLPLILIRHCRMQGRRQDVGRYCYFLDFTAKMGGVGDKVLAQGHVDRKRQGWDPPQTLSTTAPAAPHYYHCLPPNATRLILTMTPGGRRTSVPTSGGGQRGLRDGQRLAARHSEPQTEPHSEPGQRHLAPRHRPDRQAVPQGCGSVVFLRLTMSPTSQKLPRSAS